METPVDVEGPDDTAVPSEVPAEGGVAPAAEPPETPPVGRPRRRWLIPVIILVVLLAFGGLVAGLTAALKPLLAQGAQISAEWTERIDEDYPGWKMVGFNAQSYSGGGERQTTYNFTLVPPDREFVVAVTYTQEGDDRAVCKDEVLRPTGFYHSRAESLLDYIEDTYVKEKKSVTSIESDRDGTVTVSWRRVKSFGVFTSTTGSFDMLDYDDDSDTWDVTYSPGP